MFGRQVTMKLRANSAREFTRIGDAEIIPILLQQKGFCNETTFISAERLEAIASSVWDTEEDAEMYHRTIYPEILKALSNVIDGAPTVKTFEFANSTSNQAAPKVLAFRQPGPVAARMDLVLTLPSQIVNQQTVVPEEEAIVRRRKLSQ